MFGVGTQELVIIAVIVLLLFGNRLPSVMRSLGRGVVEFKKGVSGIEDEIRQVEQKPDKPANSDYVAKQPEEAPAGQDQPPIV